MEVGDAGRRGAMVGDDDVCAEEPDAEEFLTEEEEAAAVEAEEQPMDGARPAGARNGVARPSVTERCAVDDGASSEDHFVGEPVPDEEARRRWPARYRTKVRTPSVSDDLTTLPVLVPSVYSKSC
jgi:DNA (cytosine-5)-methyltransferase 1